MKNILKNWKTTIIGIVAVVGLAYSGYLNGGFGVNEFLMLVLGVGFVFAKDADKTHTSSSTSSSITGDNPDPKKEEK